MFSYNSNDYYINNMELFKIVQDGERKSTVTTNSFFEKPTIYQDV
jgi:hypothetical protein